MDLNDADHISRHPTAHTAEKRKAAAAKASRLIADPYGHPATRKRAKLVLGRLSEFEGANN